MAVKKFKPTSDGRRFMTVADFSDLSKKGAERRLVEGKTKSGGRNNNGRMTSRRKGGGRKQRYRTIDFRRVKDGVPARITALEYDPNRSARLALLEYRDGDKRYILAPVGVRVGDVVESGPTADIVPGNALPLENIPLGTIIHAVELRALKGAQLARSAGTSVQLMAKDGGYAFLKLPSGELRRVRLECRATVGQVGNVEHENLSGGKAGRNRWKGRRPNVRGIAKNPVDHPHGGGEGRSKGNHPQTPWGKPTKGYKTRGNKTSDKYIVTRRTRK